MTKQMIIIDGKTAKCYRLGKNNKPMTTVRDRLFRTDDRLFYGQQDSDNSIIVYDLDSTQPYSDSQEDYINPDLTMAIIDVGKTARGKSSIVEKLNGIDGMKFVYIAIAIIIILSVAGIV